MALEHLKDRRTGRRRGSKSRPPALLGLLWAARHLGREVEPPTPEAGFWMDMARLEPARFVAALKALRDKGGAASRRLKRLFLVGVKLPPDVQIVEIKPAFELCGPRSHGELGIWLVLGSGSFPEVQPGGAVPKLGEGYAPYGTPSGSARR
jgi:hypothetical protein